MRRIRAGAFRAYGMIFDEMGDVEMTPAILDQITAIQDARWA
jgi:hypothetical protein